MEPEKEENVDFESNNSPVETEKMLQHNMKKNPYVSSVLKKTESSVSVFVQNLKPTTYWETLTHLIKANVGCGLLAMGMAFKNAGLLLTSILVIFIGFLASYNQYVLVTLATKYKAENNMKMIGFSETIGIALENGPPMAKKMAGFVKILIKQYLIFTQLGFCCVYILFISQTLDQIFMSYNVKINLWIWILIILPIIWLTALIKELKYIAPLSTLANASSFAALGLITYCSLINLPPLEDRKLIGNWKQIPLCFGTIVYSLEGISLTLPLQQNMKKPKQFLGPIGVLTVTMIFVTILVVIVGFSGYWKFGEDVKETLTLNLKTTDSLLTQIVITCLAIGILCTYALQLFVPVQILLPNVKQWSSTLGLSKNKYDEYILRSVLVLFTFLLAESVPHLDLIISLLGAVGGSFLALIIPPVADLCSRKDYGVLEWRLIVSALSLTMGLTGCALGTVMSSTEIVHAVRKDFNI